MSYLIAMYVFYHGNNLPLFGFIPGQKEEKPLNMGLDRMSEADLSKVLPEDIAEAIVEDRKVTKLLDYESILRNAIMQSQNETAKLMNSKHIQMDRSTENPTYTTFEDPYNNYDMVFFNDMNGLGNNDDDSLW